MALKLRRPGTKPEDTDDLASSSRSSAASAPKQEAKRSEKWFGRSAPPPPHGSGYSEFLDWASNEALDPSNEDRILATTVWMGREPESDEIEEAPSMKM